MPSGIAGSVVIGVSGGRARAAKWVAGRTRVGCNLQPPAQRQTSNKGSGLVPKRRVALADSLVCLLATDMLACWTARPAAARTIGHAQPQANGS